MGLLGSPSAYAIEDILYCGEYEGIVDNTSTGSIIATYLGGCEWQLEAVPANGARFEKWSDNDDTNPIRTITVTPGDDEFSYSATFVYVFAHCSTALDYDSISTTSYGEDAGTVTVTRELQSNGSRLYKLNATPKEDYVFAGWSDGSVENPRAIPNSVDSLTVSATFIRPSDVFDIESWDENGFVAVTLSEEIDLKNVMIYKGGEIITPSSAIRPINAPEGTAGGHFHVRFDDLANHAGDTCVLVVLDYGGCPERIMVLRAPMIVTGNMSITRARYDKVDVHVLNNADLRFYSNSANSEYGTLMIYPEGRVVVNNANIKIDSIIMRADGPNASYPRLETNNGSITNTSGSVDFEYMLDFNYFYPFSLPVTALPGYVSYRTRGASDANNEFVINAYDGKKRAYSVTHGGWEPLHDTQLGYTAESIVGGVGYNIFGAPLTWNAEGFQEYGIFRFPMTGITTINNEPGLQLPVDSAGNPATVANKDRNWNAIGLPYFSNYKGEIWMLDDDDNLLGTLNYVTYTDEFFKSYKTEETETVTLLPFNSYFIQVADTATKIQFGLPSSAALAPKRRVQQASVVRDLVAGVTLAQGDKIDHTGLRLGQRYTAAYDINGDMAKQFGSDQGLSVFALSGSQKMAYIALPVDEGGETLIPLGYSSAQKGGEATFAFDTARYADRLSENIEALYLIDNYAATEVNLLEQDYTFVASEAANNTRFALNVVYRAPQQQEEQNTATGICCDTPRATSLPDGIYDLLGRRINATTKLPAGAYILIENGQARKEVIR